MINKITSLEGQIEDLNDPHDYPTEEIAFDG